MGEEFCTQLLNHLSNPLIHGGAQVPKLASPMNKRFSLYSPVNKGG